jgi:hypothetical protein
MKRVPISNPPPGMSRTEEGKWTVRMLQEISRASFENDPAVIASDFTIANYTETRTLDVGTATLTDLLNVVATLILDLQRGGAKKG